MTLCEHSRPYADSAYQPERCEREATRYQVRTLPASSTPGTYYTALSVCEQHAALYRQSRERN